MLIPDVIDRHGPAWNAERVNKAAALQIARGTNAITKRSTHVSKDLEDAAAICDKALSIFSKSLNTLMQKESEASTAAKRVSGQVRDATQKLSDGLAKLESTANFDRLERMVLLLERAEAAMTSLAKLDSDGKLARIAEAIR